MKPAEVAICLVLALVAAGLIIDRIETIAETADERPQVSRCLGEW